MTTRLRWKKEPRETVLSRYIAGPQRSNLHDGTKEYATVCTLSSRRTAQRWLWYWVAHGVGEYKNSCNEPCAEEAEAKAQAMAFVKKKLAEASEQSK